MVVSVYLMDEHFFMFYKVFVNTFVVFNVAFDLLKI
jgi:hypothetical protein